MKNEYVWTSDDLRLMGVHYFGKQTCVLMVHGMSDTIMENYWANMLGETLSAKGYGFMFAHNRGYGHINDIPTKPVKTEDSGWNLTRTGVVYELFEDCPKDIDTWIEKVKQLGYERIILLGHSLGCNKTVYYLSQRPDADVQAVILASPPDLVGLAEMERYQPNYNEMLSEATSLMAAGKPRQILSHTLWDFYDLSAQTFLSLFVEGRAADNLPVNRNPYIFEQLASIKQPILAFMGEHDDIEITKLGHDLEIIKSKAVSCADFQTTIIAGANHNYENREEAVYSAILEWIEQL